MATRRLVAGAACLGALIAACGRADPPAGPPPSPSAQAAILRMEAAVIARDEPAYRVAVDAIVAATHARSELLVLLADSLEREEREGRIWPGKTYPSAEVLLRFGRAGVHPLVQTISAKVGHELIDMGTVPAGDAVLPFMLDDEQEAELLGMVLSPASDLTDRVTAAAMLGALPRPLAPPTLRALLAFCERDDVMTEEEAPVGTGVARALIMGAERGLDAFLAALPQAPACGKIFALSFLDDSVFVQAAKGNPALLRTVDGLNVDPDPRVAAIAAVTFATLGGDAARSRTFLEARLAHGDPEVRAAAADALAEWPGTGGWVDETLLRLQWSEADRALAETAREARVRRFAKYSAFLATVGDLK